MTEPELEAGAPAACAEPKVVGAHTQAYRLRHDELGPGGYYSPAPLIGVLQEAAIDGSAHRGFPLPYYHRERAFWMLRRITLRYERPLRHGDSLAVTTWVSRVGKTSPTREYSVHSASRGERIARVRTYWVYIDMTTGRSKEIPADLRAGFAPTGEPLEPLLEVPGGPLESDQPTIASSRVASFGDVDWSGHVKCCSYVGWLEDMLANAFVAANEPAGATGLGSLDVQFLAASKAGDEVRMRAQLGDVWKVEMASASDQVVARAALWPQGVNRARTKFVSPAAESVARMRQTP